MAGRARTSLQRRRSRIVGAASNAANSPMALKSLALTVAMNIQPGSDHITTLMIPRQYVPRCFAVNAMSGGIRKPFGLCPKRSASVPIPVRLAANAPLRMSRNAPGKVQLYVNSYIGSLWLTSFPGRYSSTQSSTRSTVPIPRRVRS